MAAPAMRTLRVSLVDLELSPATTGYVWAQLTQQVSTTDGQVIGLIPIWRKMNLTGVVDFAVPANDDSGIVAGHRGFGVVIGWDLVSRGARGTRINVTNPGATYYATLASPPVSSITSPGVPVVDTYMDVYTDVYADTY